MNTISSLKNLLPNPYSNKQGLASFIKKTELISIWLNIFSAVKKIFWLIIITIVLVYFFNISISILEILFLTELIIILTNLIISFSELKEIKQTDYQKDASSSWKILLIDEYYNVLTRAVTVIENIFGVFIFILILDYGLIDFNITSTTIPYIKYFLFLIILLRLWGCVTSLIKYNLVKKIPNSPNIAELDKNYSLVNIIFEIIINSAIIAVVLLITIFLSLSKIISTELLVIFNFYFLFLLPFFIFMIYSLVYNIFSYKKMKKLNLDKQASSLGDNPVNQENIMKKSEYPDEIILGSIFGIGRSVASFKDIFSRKIGSSEFLGVGQNFSPENTLLITNHRLLFVQIPVTGGDKVISGTDYTMTNFIWNRSEVAENGKEILKSNSISRLSPLIKNEVSYKDIKLLIFNKFIINIEMTNGEKLRYAFMDKEYSDIINKIFPEYLGDKFVSRQQADKHTFE